MKRITDIEKQDLIDRLLIKVMTSSQGSYGGIGYHIKKLRGRDKLILEELTSEDFNHMI